MMSNQAEVTPRHVVEVSRWSEWCLENTRTLLQLKFPGSAVWLVRPCRMLRKLFSSFHHFVESSITGVPRYSSNHGALLHVHALLADALRREKEKGSLELSVADALNLPLVLVGFSKGCVVLNQMTHELVNVCADSSKPDSTVDERRTPPSLSGDHGNLEATPTSDYDNSDEEAVTYASKPLPLEPDELKLLNQIVSQIKAFYWLDSGHSGENGAWITEDTPLKSLASLQIPVHVDVTPQQVRDPSREWIGEEEAEFVSKLRQLGASVMETLHFEHDQKSLEKHFQVLREFKPD